MIYTFDHARKVNFSVLRETLGPGTNIKVLQYRGTSTEVSPSGAETLKYLGTVIDINSKLLTDTQLKAVLDAHTTTESDEEVMLRLRAEKETLARLADIKYLFLEALKDAQFKATIKKEIIPP